MKTESEVIIWHDVNKCGFRRVATYDRGYKWSVWQPETDNINGQWKPAPDELQQMLEQCFGELKVRQLT